MKYLLYAGHSTFHKSLVLFLPAEKIEAQKEEGAWPRGHSQ